MRSEVDANARQCRSCKQVTVAWQRTTGCSCGRKDYGGHTLCGRLIKRKAQCLERWLADAATVAHEVQPLFVFCCGFLLFLPLPFFFCLLFAAADVDWILDTINNSTFTMPTNCMFHYGRDRVRNFQVWSHSEIKKNADPTTNHGVLVHTNHI